MRLMQAARSPSWLLFVVALSARVEAGESRIELRCSTNKVGQYEKIEFQVQVPGQYHNPFDPAEADVSLRLSTPGGQSLTLPAFWCQDYERQRLGPAGRQRDWVYPRGTPGWRARFAPVQTGTYLAVGVVKDRGGTASTKAVRFVCARSSSRGFVRVSRADPRFLEFANGQPFFPIGQNLAFIGSQQYVTLSKAEDIFRRLSVNGANYLRLWTCCEDWALALEARKSAWGRSWDWRPPIVPMPTSEKTNQRCLKVSGSSTALKVDPSHPVALRPGTRYIVSGKLRTEAGAVLKLEVNGGGARDLPGAGLEGSWTPFQQPFATGPEVSWLTDMSFRVEGQGGAWIADLSLREASGGPELLWEADVNRAVRGFYNPVDCFMLDELVAAAERHGLYLQLCLLTRDLYMDSLKDPASPAYERAIQDASKLLRYAVARWGYSTSVAAWEYWNEMNPDLPTERFYAALGEYLERVDVYGHLRTTSTWGPSAKDCRHPKLDLADVHFYLRPADKARLRNEVDAVIDRTGWLRAQAPNKPIHLGEFGLANDKWQLTEESKKSPELVDVHNALWASALSGASGAALFWWWERLDERGVYPSYRPLSRFIASVPWTTGGVKPAELICTDTRVRVIGLRTRDQAWLWLFSRDASWASVVTDKRVPAQVPAVEIELQAFPAGTYHVNWWDTREGIVLREERQPARAGVLRLSAPPFARDIACQVSR